MKVGTVEEVRNHEYRVGLTPGCAAAYRDRGHEVLVQKGAGVGVGFEDRDYAEAGAALVDTAAEVYAAADMVVKVKEPQPEECRLLRDGQILFAYLHLAADRALTESLLAAGVDAVAFETIVGPGGSLPCLRPMSEIAGRLSIQEGARYLEKPCGGRGILLGGAPGVERGVVTVIGAGAVGTNACKMALGLGAKVNVLDTAGDRLARLDDTYGGRISTLYNNRANLEACLRESDLVVGAVLVPGASAPRVVRRTDLALMKPGSVIVDVAIDQGGCVESSRPTSHADPVFVEGGVIHYCVSNMPGAVPRTSTLALTSVTLGYGLALADHGVAGAVARTPGLAEGVNTYRGRCTCRGVAEAFGMDYCPPGEALGLS